MKNILSAIRSLYIWSTVALLILIWLPLLAIRRLCDRDPAHYATGFLFRKLGRAMTAVNSAWKIHISGETVLNPRNPYVVVSNHQSMADIPIISNLPWEMKWMAKKELFSLPIVGWMMRLAGDIRVDRRNARSGAQALIKAQHFSGAALFRHDFSGRNANNGRTASSFYRRRVSSCRKNKNSGAADRTRRHNALHSETWMEIRRAIRNCAHCPSAGRDIVVDAG